MIWIQQHAELLFCLVGCMLVTVIPRVGPVMYLHAESLPDLLRHWLSFVPVAVMAALLGPDVFIYQGEFMPTHHNLFLMTAIPALLVAWWSKSFFGTIAFSMGFVALMRYEIERRRRRAADSAGAGGERNILPCRRARHSTAGLPCCHHISKGRRDLRHRSDGHH